MKRWLLAAALVICPVKARAGAEQKPAPRGVIAPAPDVATWTVEQHIEANLQARVAKARLCAANKDILGWGAAVMTEKCYLPPCRELHGYFVQIRQAELTATVAPRGHAKTFIKCKLIPMFQALEEPEAYDFYLNLQSTHEKGVLVNFSIKHEFETNPVIRRMYGDQIGVIKWTDELFMLKNGVVFRGGGAGDSIRGMQFLDRRPSYVIMDDLYDQSDMGNAESIQAKNEWYWSSLYPARPKGKRSSFHTQGTVAGDNDLMLQLGEMAKTDQSIRHREFSAIDPETGLPLWPELNSNADMEKDRARMGEVAFNRESLGDRSSRGSSIIKTSHLVGWRRSPAEFRCDVISDPYTLLDVLVCIDPSVGKKQGQTAKNTGDPAAFVRLWKLQPKQPAGMLPVYFIDNVVNKVLGMQERIDAAKDMVTTARPDRKVRRVRIETISGFDDIGTLIGKAVAVPCEKVESVPDKMLNLEKHQPFFQNGRVFINDQLPLETIALVEKQLTTNRPTHDDVRDAIFLGLDDSNPSMRQWVTGS